MSPRHIALAALVAAVWGVNFVFIEIGLANFPPLLFSALRFLAAAVPAVFFVGSPRVAWRWVIAVGLILGVAKFGLLFIGMHAGMPAGLSSLVLQSQAVFTTGFAAVLLRERPRRAQVAGMLVAAAGIGLIAVDGGLTAPASAFALVVGAAGCWGLANIVLRRASPPDMFRFMVWVSAVATLPLFALSLLTEGPDRDLAALAGLNLPGVGAILYVALASTLFGFGVWGFLLREYDASTVAPFSLLVPIVGMSSAALLLGEPLTPLRCAAAALVIAGVGATVLRRRKGQTSGGAPGGSTGSPAGAPSASSRSTASVSR
ncbi:EamA family transporter [Solihabitans fulvus]|uniref:EamA family transporter n=1 Tax=Solihabitans fulvus TaxID=1892852 RepID=A0A5B2X5M3_9PSEU|nr:EamA family transporter [Solihabitans fulvus]KAA2258533.1 EamA family transporter [Solihabitans fulvus]